MKSNTYYSLRSQGISSKNTFRSEGEAFESAKTFCINNGVEVSVVMHEGDVSRLVRKVSPRR